MTPSQAIVKSLVEKFPNAPALTLAKTAYKKNPEVWSTLESCRCAFRSAFGAMGNRNRQERRAVDFTRPRRKAGLSFPALPRPLRHFNAWQAFKIPGPCKAGIISDPHIPYHGLEVVDVCLSHVRDQGCNLIILNGDVADFFSVSRWEKDPRKRDLSEELGQVRQFLTVVREGFPKARIIWKFGNHEERWENYLTLKAPELLGIEDFELSKIFKTDELGIEIVSDKRPVLLGKLYVIHGHEFMRHAIAAPVNPARGFFLRAQSHVLGGHYHQSSQHSQKNLGQTVISAWSTGALCEMHPDYAPINNWNHGFAIVDVARSGSFDVQNLRIINGRVHA